MSTRRCSERRFFLRPSPEIKQILLYCLAVGAERYGMVVVLPQQGVVMYTRKPGMKVYDSAQSYADIETGRRALRDGLRSPVVCRTQTDTP